MEKKMTKKTALECALTALALTEGMDAVTETDRVLVDHFAEAQEVIKNMISQLEKKSTTPRKPTAQQAETQHLRDVVKGFMEDNKGKAFCVAELMEKCDEIADYSTQRISSALTALVKDGYLTKEEIKRKMYYTFA